MNHYLLDKQKLASWANKYPLPAPREHLETKPGLFFKSSISNYKQKQYKRSELIAWYKATKASVEANKAKRSSNQGDNHVQDC